jgi:hypothetical protein
MNVEEVSAAVVDAAFHLHKDLGPGLLESVYEAVLARVLERRGLQVERQKSVTFDFDGMHFNECLRVDLLVEGCLVVEQIRREPRSGPSQTTSDLPPPAEASPRASDQLWRPDLQGRDKAHREQSLRLRVFAPSREQI